MAEVLVVEDEESMLHALRYNLLRAGHDVRLCTDGHQALDLVRAQPPDVLLLDLMLPKTSGNLLLKKIRGLSCFKDLPIVAFTNAFVLQMVQDALRAGATKVYDKSSMTRLMLIEAFRGETEKEVAQ